MLTYTSISKVRSGLLSLCKIKDSGLDGFETGVSDELACTKNLNTDQLAFIIESRLVQPLGL
jgi:hypothetical protein